MMTSFSSVAVEPIVLVHLDSSSDEWDGSPVPFYTKTIRHFNEYEECRTFLSEEECANIVLVVSESFVDWIVHLHEIPQIRSIYILSKRTDINPKPMKKLQGVYPLVKTIARVIEEENRRRHHQLHPVACLGPANVLNPSFMYSQILKEILLETESAGNEKEELVRFWRELFAGDVSRLKTIDEFQREYHDHTPIWWYTKGIFIYEFLNAALRTMNIDHLLRMSFFLRDIHRQIEELHRSQASSTQPSIVYRGQSLSLDDFSRLRSNSHGLLSFQSFLSTSQKREVALMFCPGHSVDSIGVLFEIHLDPHQNTAPYASLGSISHFAEFEEEILFSMHAVFRVQSIVEERENLWKVQLRSTTDEDEDLRRLTTYLRENIDESSGPMRLAHLCVHLEDFLRAEQIFQNLLNAVGEEDSDQLAHIYNQLGHIKRSRGQLSEGLEFWKKSLAIRKKFHSVNKFQLAVLHNNIGELYRNEGVLGKAFKHLRKAVTLVEYVPFSQATVVISIYSNLATLYQDLNDPRAALHWLEKVCQYEKMTLPDNHPDLARTLNSLALVEMQLKHNRKAFEHLENALKIQKKSLPPQHSQFVQTYNNFGLFYQHQAEHSAALVFYQMALQIALDSASKDRTDLTSIYRNVASIHHQQKNYSSALEVYEQVLTLLDQLSLNDHPDRWSVYDSIGEIYREQRDYTKALEYHQKALEGRNTSSSILKSAFVESYDHLGRLFYERELFSEALEYYQKSYLLQEQIYSEQPWRLLKIYETLAIVSIKMQNFPHALALLEKVRSIQEQSQPISDPDLLGTYKRIAFVHFQMKDYPQTLSIYEKALQHAEFGSDREDLQEQIEHARLCAQINDF